jgi:hypothetical protein
MCASDCGSCASDCCRAKGTTGCSQPDCMACVCAQDSICCELGWDQACVDIAITGCASTCDCAFCEDPACSCGDGTCQEFESCASCAADCGACESTCCREGSGAGCNTGTCESCVCAHDPYCCSVQWDAACASVTVEQCAGICPCVASDGPCCEVGWGPGCAEPDCEACVCALDSYCCTVWWDEFCVNATAEECGAACGCAGTVGDCCAPQPSASCADTDCASCVCAYDASCCEVVWDAHCVVTAVSKCGAECGCGCGDTVCAGGENCLNCAPDCGNCPPTCGDSLCESGESCAVCPADCGECAVVCNDGVCSGAENCVTCAQDCGACASDCCTPHLGLGCSQPDCSACVCALDDICCTLGWDNACMSLAAFDCAGACDCNLCVGSHCNCGDSVCDPEESCADCPEDCGVCSGNCCDEQESPSCTAPLCASCVCAIDSFCCAVLWDPLCSSAAYEQCVGSCGCGDAAPGPCCEPHGNRGCSDPQCEACVCDVDPFCCQVGWDVFCVNGASEECRVFCECSDAAFVCCTPHVNPGCQDPACEQCVCAASPYCCGVSWDELCVVTTVANCGAACGCGCGDGVCAGGETCASCSEDCGSCPAHDCCEAHPSVGCSIEECSQCVCAVDAWCCNVQWDTTCAEETALCPAECGCGPP